MIREKVSRGCREANVSSVASHGRGDIDRPAMRKRCTRDRIRDRQRERRTVVSERHVELWLGRGEAAMNGWFGRDRSRLQFVGEDAVRPALLVAAERRLLVGRRCQLF